MIEVLVLREALDRRAGERSSDERDELEPLPSLFRPRDAVAGPLPSSFPVAPHRALRDRPIGQRLLGLYFSPGDFLSLSDPHDELHVSGQERLDRLVEVFVSYDIAAVFLYPLLYGVAGDPLSERGDALDPHLSHGIPFQAGNAILLHPGHVLGIHPDGAGHQDVAGS